MRRFLRTIPIYIILFPVFSVLALAANNLGQIELNVIWRPLFLSAAGAGILFLLSWAILRNPQKAGFLTFSLSFFALTYGHFFRIMKDRTIGSWIIGSHLYVLILWGLLPILLIYLLVLKVRKPQPLTQIFNIVFLAVTLLQSGRIAFYEIRAAVIARTEAAPAEETLLKPEEGQPLPDVYFIILDKYGRSDALQAYFSYDNSDFIAGLEDLGFWVADCSRSNYAFTVMSLSSQLNMAYVEDLTDSPSLQTTTALIQKNKVHKAFNEIGYTTIAFDMGFKWGNMTRSDYYFDEYPRNITTWYLDPFEILYIRSTIGTFLFQKEVDIGLQATLSNLERKAERTRLILEVLPEIPLMDGPKFVHAHIITPHPPYLFNPDGTLNEDAEDTPQKIGYPAQLDFLQPRILEIMAEIIDKSPTPPIIILEGDHAFGNRYVTSNLLALYLPGEGDEGLYDQMTLINVFPYIFNTYYGTEIPLQPDLSYTHTDDWYESTPLWEWNANCWEESPAEPGIPVSP
jgi:hypothetical protein